MHALLLQSHAASSAARHQLVHATRDIKLWGRFVSAPFHGKLGSTSWCGTPSPPCTHTSPHHDHLHTHSRCTQSQGPFLALPDMNPVAEVRAPAAHAPTSHGKSGPPWPACSTAVHRVGMGYGGGLVEGWRGGGVEGWRGGGVKRVCVCVCVVGLYV